MNMTIPRIKILRPQTVEQVSEGLVKFYLYLAVFISPAAWIQINEWMIPVIDFLHRLPEWLAKL